MSALESLVVERAGTHARVALASWADAAHAAKDAGFTYFSYLSGMDWLPNPALDGEHHYDTTREPLPPQEIVVDTAVRLAGGLSRFSVMARVANVEEHAAITLTAEVGEDLHVPSWTSAYAGADWHERETGEMFGFIFEGHPNPKHIYLPDEFEGFPMRKDFALPARLVRPWPGLVDMEEMPGKEEPEQDFA